MCTATGRGVALDRMVTCSFSGERVVDDQVETSALTDRVGWRARMARSQVSGRWAGRDELVRTGAGASVLPTEAHLCPCCGRAALILPPYNSEARGCPCCDMAVCAADLGADGRCWLCVRALTEPQPAGAARVVRGADLGAAGGDRRRGRGAERAGAEQERHRAARARDGWGVNVKQGGPLLHLRRSIARRLKEAAHRGCASRGPRALPREPGVASSSAEKCPPPRDEATD